MRGGTDEVYFVQNLYVNQTNVCRVKCKFCAFAATRKQEHAYTFTSEELVEDVLGQREVTGFTEIHMVNGENPHVDFAFYRDTIAVAPRGAARRAPQVLHGLRDPPHDDALGPHARGGPASSSRRPASARSRAAAPRCSPIACGGSSRRARSRPRSGSTCTTPRIASGSRRTARCSTDMSRRTRSASTTSSACATSRTATGGFLAFIPLAFHPENTVFERRGWRHTTGADDLKMLAFSRLMLDNVPNIKAYWIMMGMPLAAVALHFGANDVQGTVVREQIFHAAGARTETEQKIDELVRFVREAGRIPVQRDTLYNELRRWN